MSGAVLDGDQVSPVRVRLEHRVDGDGHRLEWVLQKNGQKVAGATESFDWPTDANKEAIYRWLIRDAPWTYAPLLFNTDSHGPSASPVETLRQDALRKLGEDSTRLMAHLEGLKAEVQRLHAHRDALAVEIISNEPYPLPLEHLRLPTNGQQNHNQNDESEESWCLRASSWTYRTHQKETPEPRLVKGRPLRVLLITSRPRGVSDVSYRNVQRHLIELSKQNRHAIELTILRPPTLLALEETLRQARESGKGFDVVHFDGHGTAEGDEPSLLLHANPAGGASWVRASRFGRLLAAQGVQLLSLNACETADAAQPVQAVEHAPDPVASLSPQTEQEMREELARSRLGPSLVQRVYEAGVPFVLGMRYAVNTWAAPIMITEFYQHLITHGFPGRAVQQMRKTLAVHANNDSRHRDVPYWSQPYLYGVHEQLWQPIEKPSLPADESARNLVRRDGGSAGDVVVEMASFHGRDAYFVALERLFWIHGWPHDPVEAKRRRDVVPDSSLPMPVHRQGFGVFLYGAQGIGKSRLVAEFVSDFLATRGMGPDGCLVWTRLGSQSAYAVDTDEVVTLEKAVRDLEQGLLPRLRERFGDVVDEGALYKSVDLDRELVLARLEYLLGFVRELGVVWVWDNAESVFVADAYDGHRDDLALVARRFVAAGGVLLVTGRDYEGDKEAQWLRSVVGAECVLLVGGLSGLGMLGLLGSMRQAALDRFVDEELGGVGNRIVRDAGRVYARDHVRRFDWVVDWEPWEPVLEFVDGSPFALHTLVEQSVPLLMGEMASAVEQERDVVGLGARVLGRLVERVQAGDEGLVSVRVSDREDPLELSLRHGLGAYSDNEMGKLALLVVFRGAIDAWVAARLERNLLEAGLLGEDCTIWNEEEWEVFLQRGVRAGLWEKGPGWSYRVLPSVTGLLHQIYAEQPGRCDLGEMQIWCARILFILAQDLHAKVEAGQRWAEDVLRALDDNAVQALSILRARDQDYALNAVITQIAYWGYVGAADKIERHCLPILAGCLDLETLELRQEVSALDAMRIYDAVARYFHLQGRSELAGKATDMEVSWGETVRNEADKVWNELGDQAPMNLDEKTLTLLMNDAKHRRFRGGHLLVSGERRGIRVLMESHARRTKLGMRSSDTAALIARAFGDPDLPNDEEFPECNFDPNKSREWFHKAYKEAATDHEKVLALRRFGAALGEQYSAIVNGELDQDPHDVVRSLHSILEDLTGDAEGIEVRPGSPSGRFDRNDYDTLKFLSGAQECLVHFQSRVLEPAALEPRLYKSWILNTTKVARLAAERGDHGFAANVLTVTAQNLATWCTSVAALGPKMLVDAKDLRDQAWVRFHEIPDHEDLAAVKQWIFKALHGLKELIADAEAAADDKK